MFDELEEKRRKLAILFWAGFVGPNHYIKRTIDNQISKTLETIQKCHRLNSGRI